MREYTKKPSFVQINCAVRDARARGDSWIELSWGENLIVLDKTPSGWIGRGWIGKSSGQDIADRINRNGV